MNYQLIDTKQYYLSSNSKSATKNNGTFNSDITFYIPNLIKKADNILYNTIKITHCEFPHSIYVVNIYNNYFKFNNIDVFIPVGNYNANTLLETLNTQLQTIDPNIIMTLNLTNGKYTLTSTTIFNINVSVSNIYKILGFENSIYNGIFDGSNFVLDFPYPANFMGIRNIFIKMNNLILDNLNLTTNDKATLKSIPVNVPPFGVIMYNNNENTETLIKNPETDYLQLQLTDDDNNLINFNNLEWSICIEIKTTITTIKNITNNLIDYLNNTNEQ